MAIYPFPEDFLEKYRNGFCDFGCSAGGSIRYLSKKFKVAGFGIDIDEAKLEAARAAGFEALNIDLFECEMPRNIVAFSSMFHVLEHLHSEAQTRIFIDQAIRMSRKFVLVRYPNFDLDPLLAQKGLKFYHSDWSGHTNHLSSYNLFKLVQRVTSRKILDISIYGRQLLSGPTDTIIPLSAPINTSYKVAKTYELVDSNMLGVPVYKETAMIVRLRGASKVPLKSLEDRMKVRQEHCLLYQRREDF